MCLRSYSQDRFEHAKRIVCTVGGACGMAGILESCESRERVTINSCHAFLPWPRVTVHEALTD